MPEVELEQFDVVFGGKTRVVVLSPIPQDGHGKGQLVPKQLELGFKDMPNQDLPREKVEEMVKTPYRSDGPWELSCVESESSKSCVQGMGKNSIEASFQHTRCASITHCTSVLIWM